MIIIHGQENDTTVILRFIRGNKRLRLQNIQKHCSPKYNKNIDK
jgi:hypothetical protein